MPTHQTGTRSSEERYVAGLSAAHRGCWWSLVLGVSGWLLQTDSLSQDLRTNGYSFLYDGCGHTAQCQCITELNAPHPTSTSGWVREGQRVEVPGTPTP